MGKFKFIKKNCCYMRVLYTFPSFRFKVLICKYCSDVLNGSLKYPKEAFGRGWPRWFWSSFATQSSHEYAAKTTCWHIWSIWSSTSAANRNQACSRLSASPSSSGENCAPIPPASHSSRSTSKRRFKRAQKTKIQRWKWFGPK